LLPNSPLPPKNNGPLLAGLWFPESSSSPSDQWTFFRRPLLLYVIGLASLERGLRITVFSVFYMGYLWARSSPGSDFLHAAQAASILLLKEREIFFLPGVQTALSFHRFDSSPLTIVRLKVDFLFSIFATCEAPSSQAPGSLKPETFPVTSSDFPPLK